MPAAPQQEHTPIVSISASTFPTGRERRLAAGAAAFEPKPVRVSELVHAIGNLMGLTWRYERASAAGHRTKQGRLDAPALGTSNDWRFAPSPPSSGALP
jgi:DNA-binding NarL/FixJ family response regulator